MIIARRLIRDRRVSTAWWALGIVAAVVLVVLSYSTVAGDSALDESFDDIPESLRVLLGVDGETLSLTSPAGYLNSQLFANFLPLLLIVFGIGIGAAVIAGEEGKGRLELLLGQAVSRRRVALERLLGAVGLLFGLTILAGLAVLLTPAPDLDVGLGPASAATASSFLLALFHLVVAYAVGAYSGRSGVAIGIAAAVAASGFLVQSLVALSDTLRPLRWLSPWQWFTDDPPIVHGWSALVAPGLAILVICALLVAAGVARFERRDIRSN